jgi:hypothetical protein
MGEVLTSRHESRELAIGAIFGDGEPSVRLRKNAAPRGPVSLLSVSIKDGDDVIGFAISLSEFATGKNQAEDVEALTMRVQELGGRSCFIEQRTIQHPPDTSALLVQTLLDLQALSQRS